MKNIAIILSGGRGTRLGANIPKQYIEVQNKPIIMYCIETFAQMDDISEIVICLADECKPFVDECIKRAYHCHYHGTNTDDVDLFINSVILKGEDNMKCLRDDFHNNVLLPPNNCSVAENIVKEIKKSIYG